MANPTAGPGAARVPVTAIGSFAANNYADIAIGDQLYGPPSVTPDSYWLLVVDLTSLQVVANVVVGNNTNVDTSVQQYAGNGQYLLFALSLSVSVDNVPQGALYQLLVDVGAGSMLAKVEQVNEQFSSGVISDMSYILAATMDFSDGKGFEELSFDHRPVMTFQLLPVTVNGQTIYTPIQTGA